MSDRTAAASLDRRLAETTPADPALARPLRDPCASAASCLTITSGHGRRDDIYGPHRSPVQIRPPRPRRDLTQAELGQSRVDEFPDQRAGERLIDWELESTLGLGVLDHVIGDLTQHGARVRKRSEVSLERREAGEDLALKLDSRSAVRDALLSAWRQGENCLPQRAQR